MSALPPAVTAVNSGQQIAKKRKRKRTGANKAAQSNAPSGPSQQEPSDFKGSRSNKKITFDEDDTETQQITSSRSTASQTTLDLDNLNGSTTSVASEGSSSQADKGVSSITNDEKTSSNGQSKTDETINGKTQGNLPISSRKMKNRNATNTSKTVAFYDRDEIDDEDDDEFVRNSFHKPTESLRSSMAQRARDLLEVRKTLPIYQHKDVIEKYVAQNQVTVIIGETGSGKSTQIPQFLMKSNKKQIAVTQPRRVAAASLAARVSEEYGCQIGQEVGYQVRFSNFTSNRTKLKYLTDGMLLREIMLDRKLQKYSTIIIDEAHERTILTDLILGFLKSLIISKERRDLKLIIMSATLNAELFSKFFNDAPILFVEGKMYPVSRHYLSEPTEDVVDTMVRAVVQINMSELEGDILCFLPGQEEIDNCVTILQQLSPELPKEAPLIVPLPLYAALSPSQQSKIFEKLEKRRRKVILATNIAETSITVSGVKYVVDSGLRKVKVWKHQLGLSTLLTTPISQASAKQRAGRAGRESAGKVFRLYLEDVFTNKLPKQQESEITRNDIIYPILTLKKVGVDDLLNWTWLEHPGQDAILSALNTLYSLGALNDNGEITPLGYKMAILPLAPQLAVVLITALEYGVLASVIDIVACLSVDNLILNVNGGNGELRDEVNFKRRQFSPLGAKHGDLITLKEYFDYFNELSRRGNIDEVKLWCKEMFFSYKGFKNVLRVKAQLKDYMEASIKQDDSLTTEERSKQLRVFRSQLDQSTIEDDFSDDGMGVDRSLDIPSILKSFLKGYITNTAVGMPDRSYRTFNTGQLISIHPSSTLFGKSNLDAIMYIEYVYTAKAYGRNCCAIELSWLQEVAPQILGSTKVSVNN